MFRIFKDTPKVSFKDEEGRTNLRNKPIAYLQHGLIDSSDSFITHYKEKAQGFILAEAGYDVWLGNSRGNKYSRQHMWLDLNELEYWEHSFPEMAKYDMPAFFDYIRNHTQIGPSEKFTYIGHSQGTTQMFYKMATEPEFVKANVNLFIGMGPFMVTHYFFSVKLFADLVQSITPWLYRLHKFEFFSADETRSFFTNYCGYLTGSCQWWQHYISTKDTTPYDYEIFRVMMGHYPSGSSLQCVNHFTQNANEN